MSMDKDVMQYVAKLEEQEQAKIQEAINKIDAEADSMKNDVAVRITSYIIDNYITNAENAEKVMDKALSDCISSVKNKARKQAKNGCAMIEDRTVWNWVEEFYKFATDEVAETQATAPVEEPKQEPNQQGPVNLLDFL